MAGNSGEFVSVVEKNAKKEVDDLIKKVTELREAVNKSGNAFKGIKVPSDAKRFITELNSVLKQNNILLEQQVSLNERLKNSNNTVNESRGNAVDKIEKERLAELKLTQDRIKAFQKYEDQLQKKLALEAKDAQNIQKESDRIIAQKQREAKQYDQAQKSEAASLARKSAAEAKAAKETARNIEKERLAQIQVSKAREKAFDNFEKINSPYSKLSSELNTVRGQAKNLAAEMFNLEQAGEQNSAQYQELANTYANVSSRVTLLDNGLKKIDGDLGQHQRSVGDYARGWNGLGNAINQLTREAPAFAVSLSTGFLAISNNLPILVDEINNLNRENEQLRANGQPTENVFKKIASAVFSFQTLLSVGVTLLTLYGSKLIDWALSATKATGELELLRRATEDYQNTIVETTTASERELTALNRKLAVAKDVTKSEEERLSAAKEIIEQYPGYLKSLTAEEIALDSNKQQTQAYIKQTRLLTADIQKRVEAEAKQDKARANLKIVAELEQEAKIRRTINEEAADLYRKYGDSKYTQQELKSITDRIEARKELLKEDKEFQSKFGVIGTNKSGNVQQLGLYTDSQITQIELRAQALRNIVEQEQKEVNQAFQETSLLDFKPDNAEKHATEALKDYIANEYELIKTRLENQIYANKEIVGNDEESFADREAALERFGELSLELADRRRIENLRLIEKATYDEIKELNKRASEGEITRSNANAVIATLEKQRHYDSLKAYEDYSQEVKTISADVEKSLEGVWSGISEQERQNKADQQRILNLRQIGLLLANVDGNTSLSAYDNLENSIRAISRAESTANEEDLRQQQEALGVELAKLGLKEKNKINNEAANELIAKQLKLEQQILGITNARAEAIEKLRESNKRATLDYLQGISEGFLSSIGLDAIGKAFQQVTYDVVNAQGVIEQKTASTFERLYDQAQTSMEKFAVVFNTVTEIAQQAFIFVRQNQQAAFDADLAGLEQEYSIRQKFANGNADAEEELERQLAEKKRDIRIKEAKAAKETALFNAIINTAQAVVSALPNYSLAAVVGALGAAQIALIASQEVPAYAEGTDNHIGGKAWVGDGGRHEVIRTPDGKLSITPNKATLIDLPKGSKVYPDIASSGLLSNGLPTQVVNTIEGLSKSDMETVMANTLAKMPINNVTINKRGIATFAAGAGAKRQSHNNRVNFKPNRY